MFKHILESLSHTKVTHKLFTHSLLTKESIIDWTQFREISPCPSLPNPAKGGTFGKGRSGGILQRILQSFVHNYVWSIMDWFLTYLLPVWPAIGRVFVLGKVIKFNIGFQETIIPIGRHTLMFGFCLNRHDIHDSEKIGALVSGVNRLFRRMDVLREWRATVMRENIGPLGYHYGVRLADYLRDLNLSATICQRNTPDETAGIVLANVFHKLNRFIFMLERSRKD